MADPEHLRILESGVEEWNRWRGENRRVRPDLTGVELPDVDLSGANLAGVDLANGTLEGTLLVGAKLVRAELSGSDLTNADLSVANLSGANLSSCDLVFSDLSGADLSDSNLSGSELSGADLSAADLSGSELSEAMVFGTQLWGTHLHRLDLRWVQGLEAVAHHGPSPISSQTLEKSKGQIPEQFLKGCGLPDWAIESTKLYNPNLRRDEVIDLTYRIADMRTEAPIVPRSIFISYSNQDMDFIEKLEARFDDDGIRSWRDVKDMVAGPIEQQIDRAIGAQKVVLLVLSKNSIRSDWVEWEVRRARELQKDLQEYSDEAVHVLCPVAIDRSWWGRNPWPARLRTQVEEYNIVDLSQWNSDEDVFRSQYEMLKVGLGIYYRDY